MPLFVCSRCGCVDNTAESMGSAIAIHTSRAPSAAASYRKVLGLTPEQEFGRYCSVCNPIWFTVGSYGIGPNPKPTPGFGIWHGRFKREFLPKGEFITNDMGEIVRKGLIPEKPASYYRETEWPPTFTIHGDDDLHFVGDDTCPAGWCNGGRSRPFLHEGCGGLVHANFGDENYDDYWLVTQCDKCGEAIDR